MDRDIRPFHYSQQSLLDTLSPNITLTIRSTRFASYFIDLVYVDNTSTSAPLIPAR